MSSILVPRKQLAEQLGIHSTTLAVWMGHYSLCKFLKRTETDNHTIPTMINVNKAFCKAFWHYLRNKKEKYRYNFNKYYHNMIFNLEETKDA